MRRRFLSGVVAVAAALVVMAVLAAPSQAQFRSSRVGVGPAFGQASWVTPYVRLQQQAYANAVIGQSLYYYPPWAFGYNPYPRVVNYYGYPYPSYPSYYPSPYYGGYYSAPYTASYVTPYLYGPGYP